MEYVWIGAGMIVLATIAVAFFQGKSSGVANTENKTLKEIDSVQDKQAAILVQPRTPADTARSLHDGNF